MGIPYEKEKALKEFRAIVERDVKMNPKSRYIDKDMKGMGRCWPDHGGPMYQYWVRDDGRGLMFKNPLNTPYISHEWEAEGFRRLPNDEVLEFVDKRQAYYRKLWWVPDESDELPKTRSKRVATVDA